MFLRGWLLQEEFAHCQAIVRESDRDRDLAALFVPFAVRRHLLALYAFNVELSLVGDRARDLLAGEARLQWWREAVSGNAKADAAANPVASALEKTIAHFTLARSRLVQMIEARMFDLFTEPMPDVQTLNAYLQNTVAPVFSLAAQIGGAKKEDVESVAQDSGIAYGLTQVLRNFPFHASRGKIYLPLDVLEKHGTDIDAILQGQDSSALASALAEIRAMARERLYAAETKATQLASGARRVFLPLSLVDLYLSLMDRPDYEPFRTPVEIPQWRRQWTLWRASRRF